MDDEAQDRDPMGSPSPIAEDGIASGEPDGVRPPDRGDARERRLAEARAARERVLAARAAEGLPPPALIARRPFDGDAPEGPGVRTAARTGDDPLAGRPKPWETAGPASPPPPAASAPLPVPSTSSREPARIDRAPAEVLVLEGAARRAAVPMALESGRGATALPRLPAALRSTGGIAAAVLVGLGVGLVGGLSLDRYVDPNTAEASAPRGEEGRAEEGGAAGADMTARPGPGRPEDAPQPRIAPEPVSAPAVAAMPDQPPALPAERRSGMVAGPPSGTPMSPPAGADAAPAALVRLSELSPRLFLGDGDRAAAEPSAPEPGGGRPEMPREAAAFISPGSPSRTDAFDAADAAPWLVTRPAGVPSGTSGILGPAGDLSVGEAASPAREAEVRRMSAALPGGYADAVIADPAPAVDLAAVPQPLLMQPVIAGPPASGRSDGPAEAWDAGMRGARTPQALFPPASGFALPALSPAPPPAAALVTTAIADARDADTRSDIRLVGGSAADRRRLEAEGIEFAATVEAAFPAIRREVRFFHAGDSALAERIARELGAEARDFSSFRPAPPEGRIEVRLPQE